MARTGDPWSDSPESSRATGLPKGSSSGSLAAPDGDPSRSRAPRRSLAAHVALGAHLTRRSPQKIGLGTPSFTCTPTASHPPTVLVSKSKCCRNLQQCGSPSREAAQAPRRRRTRADEAAFGVKPAASQPILSPAHPLDPSLLIPLILLTCASPATCHWPMEWRQAIGAPWPRQKQVTRDSTGIGDAGAGPPTAWTSTPGVNT